MKTLMSSKLTRRWLILAVMILGLVYVASSDRYARPVMAAPCCEYCPGEGDPVNGWLGCLGPSLSAACQVSCALNLPECLACRNACVHEVNSCYNHCVWCDSPGGPGVGCNSNSDCPWDQFCAADNMCHDY